ncbi:putative E3 ubiquitin-protein ligase RZFP34 [Dictyocoela roeselum]|nr:putative E3 ubiquitin-protein ligase RZFP34 [Dictyocoela roeselum]
MPFETGCPHYTNNCLLITPCCQRTYPCSLCHDKNESHKMKISATKFMICLFCGTTQNIRNECIVCNKEMATYFCAICNLFDERPFFHCDKCKMCFRGRLTDFFHCNECRCCLEIALKDNHTHIENSLKGCCPICAEYFFESIKNVSDKKIIYMDKSVNPGDGYDKDGFDSQNIDNTDYCKKNGAIRNNFDKRDVLILECGHPMHRDCYQLYKKTNYSCPICRKTMGDNEIMNKMIQELIENNPTKTGIMCNIFCYDCRSVSSAKYVFLFNRCLNCASFNTRVTEVFGDIDKKDDKGKKQ